MASLFLVIVLFTKLKLDDVPTLVSDLSNQSLGNTVVRELSVSLCVDQDVCALQVFMHDTLRV